MILTVTRGARRWPTESLIEDWDGGAVRVDTRLWYTVSFVK